MDKLYLTQKGQESTVYPLGKTAVTIGRLPDNDIVLPDESISSRHARLEHLAAGWQIVDLNSTNGTYLNQEGLQANQPYPWPPHVPLFIGPYTLLWEPVASAEPVSPKPPLQSTGPTNLGSISLEPISAQLAPGSQQEIVVQAVNEAQHVEQYTVEVEGLPKSWLFFEQTRVQLMPDLQKTTFKFQVRIPVQGALAQTYPYRLILRSAAEQREEGCAYGNLIVLPVPGFSASLKPSTIKNKGNCQVVINNQGNAPADYMVTSFSDSPTVQFTQSAQMVRVPAGQEERVTLGVSAAKRPFTGTKADSQTFKTAVIPQQGETKTLEGKLEIWPLISRQLLMFIALILGLPVACSAINLRQAIPLAIESATATAVSRAVATDTFVNEMTATATAAVATITTMAATQEAEATATWIAAGTATVDASDADGDGLPYAEELLFGTNPTIPDSDYDGLTDGEEKLLGTSPDKQDTDGDKIFDNVDPEPLIPAPTATPQPRDHNILPNPSFEGDSYYPTVDGEQVKELQIPEGWFIQAFDGDNFLAGGPGNFFRVESRILSTADLPEAEWELFIFDGEYTLKVFKGDYATAFTLYTEADLPQAGLYRITINFFSDAVIAYQNGQKVFDTRPDASEASIIFGAGLSTEWAPVPTGSKQTIFYEFEVEHPGPTIVGASFRNRYIAPNNGWFLDDWSLLLIQSAESKRPILFPSMVQT